MAQMEINYPQIMMTGSGNSSSGDPTSNYFQLLQLDHLEALRNRLNPGTSTPLLSTAGTKIIFPKTKNRKVYQLNLRFQSSCYWIHLVQCMVSV